MRCLQIRKDSMGLVIVVAIVHSSAPFIPRRARPNRLYTGHIKCRRQSTPATNPATYASISTLMRRWNLEVVQPHPAVGPKIDTGLDHLDYVPEVCNRQVLSVPGLRHRTYGGLPAPGDRWASTQSCRGEEVHTLVLPIMLVLLGRISNDRRLAFEVALPGAAWEQNTGQAGHSSNAYSVW